MVLLPHATRITTASVNALVDTDVGLFIGLLPSFFGRTAGAHSELLTNLYYSLDIPHITSPQSYSSPEAWNHHFGICAGMYGNKVVAYMFCAATKDMFDKLYAQIAARQKLFTNKPFVLNNCKYTMISYPSDTTGRANVIARIISLNQCLDRDQNVVFAKMQYPLTDDHCHALTQVRFLKAYAPLIPPTFDWPADNKYCFAFTNNSTTIQFVN
jgi:hypothetical protein